MEHITDPDYKGKLVLVTGAAQRVGADTVRYLSRHDLNFLVHYNRSKDAAEALKTEIEENSAARVELVAGDLSKEEVVKAIFAAHSPDIIINNAGKFDQNDFDANMKANAEAPYYVNRYAIERLLADGKEGHIFIVGDASIESGIAYPPELDAYTMSKAWIPDVVSQLAVAHGQQGIWVNGILNGAMQLAPNASNEAILAMQAEINVPRYMLNPLLGGQRTGQAIWGLLIAPGVNGETVRVDGARRWRAQIKEHK